MSAVGLGHIGFILPIVGTPFFTKKHNRFVLFFLLFVHFHWLLCDNTCAITWLYKRFTCGSNSDLEDAFGKYYKPIVCVLIPLYWLVVWKLLVQGGMKPAFLYMLVCPLIAAKSYNAISNVFMPLILYLTFCITRYFSFTKEFVGALAVMVAGKQVLQPVKKDLV